MQYDATIHSIAIRIKPVANNAPKAIGPYSHAIQIGDFLFTSGQIPIDPYTGNLVKDNIKEQTQQVFKNLIAVLETANANLSGTVKATVFLKNLEDFASFNEIYAQYFNEPYPARSCIEIARLPKDVLVEIELIVAM